MNVVPMSLSNLFLGFLQFVVSLACITPDIENLMHILIILSTFAIVSSFMGFCMDMIGPSKQYLKVLRRNAVPSITTVFVVITIIGMCYFVTRSLELSLHDMKIQPDTQTTYDYGSYSVTAAGSFSIWQLLAIYFSLRVLYNITKDMLAL